MKKSSSVMLLTNKAQNLAYIICALEINKGNLRCSKETTND